jgi:hypothetical protein
MISPVAWKYGGPMAAPRLEGKFYHLFTVRGAFSAWLAKGASPRSERDPMVVGIAVALFVTMFAWGANYFGWHDPDGKVQLALATSFILGIVSGYKARN